MTCTRAGLPSLRAAAATASMLGREPTDTSMSAAISSSNGTSVPLYTQIKNMAAVGADAELAAATLRATARCRATWRRRRKRGQGGGQQSVAVGVGLDHTYHRRAGSGPAGPRETRWAMLSRMVLRSTMACAGIGGGRPHSWSLALLGRECGFQVLRSCS